MSRPLMEMADIVRCAGQSFVEHSRRWINWQHQKVLLAIARCRTVALGGHRDRCTGCGYTARISYNSCRNRHCPRCQGNARRRWLKAREGELLCPLAMCTPSSHCRGNWPRSPCRTSGWSTTCSSKPAPRPCLKSLMIHGISVPRSVSSACFTAGISACS